MNSNSEMNELSELLFFDTFAHDITEEINLDLVQFPKPVYVTEVRIIPLGARVQADFPGGVRLGATNPSQFKIEFFVNDLGKPGASTFESLGGFEYNQNGCINLQCTPVDDSIRRIPTDGLVLKGWYTTITLAVYGTITKNITEQIVQPVANPPVVVPSSNLIEPQQSIATNRLETEWPTENLSVPIEYDQGNSAYPQQYSSNDQYQGEYQEYYNDPPKDPRNYHIENPEWNKVCSRSENEGRAYEKSSEREHRSEQLDKRDKEKYSGSRDRSSREYRASPRDSDHDNIKSDRDRGRDRSYKHDDSRSSRYRDEKERENDKKRPRTPPLMSPKRPKTPHETSTVPTEKEVTPIEKEIEDKSEEPMKINVEEFEPILSDEDILDDNDQFQDLDDFDTENDDSLKVFVPGQTELAPHIYNKYYQIDNESNTVQISENLKVTIGICDDYFKSSITKYTVQDFVKLNVEIKEEFIHLCEKLISIVGTSEIFDLITELYLMSNLDVEINEQIRNIFETTSDWLKIALNYELANSQEQPIHKIRHIKCGLRLAHFCFESRIFVEHLLKNEFDIFKILQDLYQQEFMAPSIKLMVLKALDTSLIHKYSMNAFLNENNSNSGKQNGCKNEMSNYKILLEQLRFNTSVRIKFSLFSIIKKINLFEMFMKFEFLIKKLKNSEAKLTINEINIVTTFLVQILQYLRNGQFTLTQPKRFLPVSSQFEINRDLSRNTLIEFFKMFNFIESLVILLTSPTSVSSGGIFTPVLEIISDLSEREEGIIYFSSKIDAVNILLKILIQNEDEEQYIDHLKSHNLGVMLAFKLRCFYHVNRLKEFGEKCNFDLTSSECLNELHNLFSLSLSGNGKVAIGCVLGMKENFKALIQFINVKEKIENQFLRMKKSPGILYLIDLIHLVLNYSSNIRILEKFGKEIHHILNFNGQQEVCCAKLSSIASLLSPVQNNTIIYDNISPFVEIIRKEIENINEKPEEIMTCLRVIFELGVSKYSTNSENPFNNFVELKYKHVILQLFSLDGVALITKILQKLCDFYTQPSVHSSSFNSHQGLLNVEIIHPCIILLKNMLSYAIQCRNTSFKDLTSVPVLLQTYNLMFSYSMDSPHYLKCIEVRENIVETLLVYTQPVSDEIHEKDTLNKTLWSMMCKEVIQFITQAPHTFVSGLLVFSELLPLPLPIQTAKEPDEKDASWMISLRKLWAAHLHPHSVSIQDFVNKLCTTSNQSLLNLLRRICVQISDLAANSSLMIARGILDAVLEEVQQNSDVIGSLRLARLLNFLACLVTHNTIKCAVLSLLQINNNSSQNDVKYASLISSFLQILKKSDHVQCQECVLSIIQSFCDVEISLIQNNSVDYLANSLPIKEHLISFIEAIIEHLSGESSNSNSFVTYLPSVRALLLLTEHDYGFYHLRENLLKKPKTFTRIFMKLSENFSKENPDHVTLLSTLIEFFHVVVVVEEVVEQANHSPRTMKMGINELKSIIGWMENEEKHPLETLKESIKAIVEEDATFDGLLEKISSLINLITMKTEIEDATHLEPILPPPEPLLSQFSCRVIFNNSDTFNERLTVEYWLSVPNEESEIENINVDLTEISKQDLSNEYNLIHEIEVLCRITSSGLNEKNENKKSDDAKMKKPLVSPLRTRGFPRMIQQRPDLFRSRPPNTSRPPSLHVDDFVALETCGAQPTGPTGYNKLSRELMGMASRNSRGVRGGRAAFSDRASQYRQMSWWGSGFGRLPY